MNSALKYDCLVYLFIFCFSTDKEDKLSVNNAEDKDSTVTNDDDDTDVEQLKQQLMAEAKLRREAEKQLNIQVRH